MWSRLHDRWGDPPHVTSPIRGPLTPDEQTFRRKLSAVFRACLHGGGGPQVGEVNSKIYKMSESPQ